MTSAPNRSRPVRHGLRLRGVSVLAATGAIFATGVVTFAAIRLCGESPEQAPDSAHSNRRHTIATTSVPGAGVVQLCQALGPAAPYNIWGVDSADGRGCGEPGWDARRCQIPWQEFAQGEYVGHARTAHVPEYRLRVDDTLAIFYLRTREVMKQAYELQVGDRVLVESLTAGVSPGVERSGRPQESSADAVNRELVVQPDGMITLPMVGRVPAAQRTIDALQDDLDRRFSSYFTSPEITVTPVQMNTRLEDLLATVDSRSGLQGGLQLSVVVTPAGKVQLPGLGSVYVQGLTMPEAKQEIDARYASTIPGVSVSVDLTQRAKRFLYVVGEVGQPGRFELEQPTTVMQAITIAGGWKLGANLRQVVVFRRGPDWRLMATMVDVQGAFYARRPTPADDIWLNDSDIVLVPKSALKIADDILEQVFTRGIYAAVPQEMIWNINFATTSAL